MSSILCHSILHYRAPFLIVFQERHVLLHFTGEEKRNSDMLNSLFKIIAAKRPDKCPFSNFLRPVGILGIVVDGEAILVYAGTSQAAILFGVHWVFISSELNWNVKHNQELSGGSLGIRGKANSICKRHKMRENM